MKYIYILFFIAITWHIGGQTILTPDTLSKVAWEKLFKKSFGKKVKKKLTIKIKNNNYFFPENWYYDDIKKDCSECNYLFYTIDENSFLLIMYNDVQVGNYIFYFNDKKISKSWVQINYLADVTNFFRINSELYMFELKYFDYSKNENTFRYIFLNPSSGIITNEVIDTFANTLEIMDINDSNKSIRIKINNNYFYYSYKFFKFIEVPINPKGFIISDCIFRYIKKIK
ncbi:hypothetical protein FMM05_02590 [Flavobacterium zepuense]|uniref:Uncharacterized protein n=1 Tax=Flavobacterium zepuense TaxID=2593302 RepID=A0A552VAP2_9FLAO|nr:hypothetical protein [Flavobacterium zepuense]TRW27546.1 hypothetical protein FMM05_02590 [Flavobacterium zepuense]